MEERKLSLVKRKIVRRNVNRQSLTESKGRKIEVLLLKLASNYRRDKNQLEYYFAL